MTGSLSLRNAPCRMGRIGVLLGLLMAGGMRNSWCAGTPVTPPATGPRWVDARELTLEGRGWSDTKDFYDRLPAKAEGRVRASVWGLSHDSAGLRVRFVTDATALSARWTVRKESLAMSHMAATGVSGLDLYVKENGRWHWIGTGRPEHFPTNEKSLVSGLAAKEREFALYLPLYNGVKELQLGVPPEAKLRAAPPATAKPVVFYGTSITQGGCASRSGMAYPALLGRSLDWPTINLGFSGNAHSEPEMAALLAELAPAVYVLDPLPNMTAEMVTERLEPLVKTLRQAHPDTPILLVESIDYPAGELVTATRENIAAKNAALQQVYQRLQEAGIKHLTYVSGGQLIGLDGLGTVDGVHPTDLGFARMAEGLQPDLQRALKSAR
ncbi:MAG TPA: SGNH/GDSL hydrolase family protein [Verrucomicrobiota bacterium]|nr:SGNH/GDSL hydrolase family protein [Verrucomicrobiota bacterium]